MTLATESPSRAGLGAPTLVLIAMAAFASQDIAVKLVVDEISLWQLMMVRSIATLGLMVTVAAILAQGADLVPRRWGWPLLRAVFMCGAYLFFYASLPFLSVTVAAATFFTGPLFITLMAAAVLGEPIGPRRIVAVIVGFIGVIVIIRPGAEDLRLAAFLPLGAALCYAAGNVLTRWRCRDEPNFALSLVHNLVYANLGMLGTMLIPLLPGMQPQEWPFLMTGWREPSALAVALIMLTAGTHLIGLLCIVRAYKNEDASRIAPFEYSYLAMIPALEFLIWQSVPDAPTFGGIALISAAGIFVAWREGRPVRPRVQTQGEHPWTPDAEENGR
ncbi:MAG: DMT family transporter [Pseudomonadota bacterium]